MAEDQKGPVSADATLKRDGSAVSVKNNFDGTWQDMNKPETTYQEADLKFAVGKHKGKDDNTDQSVVEAKLREGGQVISVRDNGDGTFVDVADTDKVYQKDALRFHKK